jgi:single-stranded DNA-binding protein
MGTRKTHDLAVKVGSYVDSQGETRNRYVQVGGVFEKDDGSQFISINRTFNPAGVPNPDNKEGVLLSRFEVKPRDGAQRQQQAPAAAPARQAAPKSNASGFDDMADDIPF